MAEWAQPRWPLTNQDAERGRWYRVESGPTREGVVKVFGLASRGTMTFHESKVRLIDHDPDMITRMQVTGNVVGKATPVILFEGICPGGHLIKQLTVDQEEAHCSACGKSYRVEDEEHINNGGLN